MDETTLDDLNSIKHHVLAAFIALCLLLGFSFDSCVTSCDPTQEEVELEKIKGEQDFKLRSQLGTCTTTTYPNSNVLNKWVSKTCSRGNITCTYAQIFEPDENKWSAPYVHCMTPDGKQFTPESSLPLEEATEQELRRLAPGS